MRRADNVAGQGDKGINFSFQHFDTSAFWIGFAGFRAHNRLHHGNRELFNSGNGDGAADRFLGPQENRPLAKPPCRKPPCKNHMRKSYVIALIATILLAVGLAIYFHQTQPPDQDQTHQQQQIQDIVGVGLLLRMDPSTHAVFIQEVVPGSPAANAGITTGLVVNKVDEVSLAGKRLIECVNLVRGTVGSTVELELINPDLAQTNTFKLTRQKINLQLKNPNQTR